MTPGKCSSYVIVCVSTDDGQTFTQVPLWGDDKFAECPSFAVGHGSVWVS
jgi:hypothetical protein